MYLSRVGKGERNWGEDGRMGRGTGGRKKRECHYSNTVTYIFKIIMIVYLLLLILIFL